MTIITSQGLNFNIDDSGFVLYHATVDRDLGIDAIQSALDAMPPEAISALHKASKAWIESDCDGDRPHELDRIEHIGHAAATRGWHRPSAVSFFVSAA